MPLLDDLSGEELSALPNRRLVYASPNPKDTGRGSRGQSFIGRLLSTAEKQLGRLVEEDNAPDDDDDSEEDRDGSEASTKEEGEDSPNPGVTINGEVVRIRKERVRVANFKSHKTWNKHG